MKVPSLVVVLLLTLAAAPARTSLSSPEVAAVDAFIKSQERITSRTYQSENLLEYRDARLYRLGDVDGDGTLDVVVEYTMEQATRWTLYLAVFRRPEMRELSHACVGDKGVRSVQLAEVQGGAIKLKCSYYSPYDALCCPSIPGVTWYRLDGGILRESELQLDCEGFKKPVRPK